MDATGPDATEPGDLRQATLHCGVASLTATAERAPFIQHGRAPEGRGAVSDMRLPPGGHDQPRRTRRRRTDAR
ncbi:hypothetical protein SRB17_15690 [Streptomyces sp. RB17]|uniref:DUF6380 family protein n=1 Tax=Streptomyces sp. RB17 TaxID=2585197 RepID=UPI00130A8A11|nr:DUF6380 family protein [Streptomyces sp. RB17]MQY33608.1 hypothetical protein [Streptomyces sp. RB17]